MRPRLTRVILVLYPRRVRKRHGPEIVALIDELIAHDGRSRARLFTRLALDGLVQRTATIITAWTVAGALAITGVAGLAVSDFATASAHQRALRTTPTISPARGRQTPRHHHHPASQRRSSTGPAIRGRRVATERVHLLQ